jgi:hypothetical protein
MKQTAVEWLEQELYKTGWEQLTHEEKMNICCTAKMMERKQIDTTTKPLNQNKMENKRERRERSGAIGTMILIGTIILLTIINFIYEISTK